MNWSWTDNPFIGTPELGGLKVLMMLLSDWDNKDARDAEKRGTNTAIYQHGDVLYYFIDDWGGAMGRWGKYFTRSKWNADSFLKQSCGFRELEGRRVALGLRRAALRLAQRGRQTERRAMADAIPRTRNRRPVTRGPVVQRRVGKRDRNLLERRSGSASAPCKRSPRNELERFLYTGGIDTLLHAENVTKHYGGVCALRDAHFSLRRGEVHALIGENGAGKSTLGADPRRARPTADHARISIDGQAVAIRHPRDAQRLGIGIIYQELDLFPSLTAGENIVIGNLHLLYAAASHRALLPPVSRAGGARLRRRPPRSNRSRSRSGNCSPSRARSA